MRKFVRKTAASALALILVMSGGISANASELSNDPATISVEETVLIAFNELTRVSRMAGQGRFLGQVNTPGSTLIIRYSPNGPDTGRRLPHGAHITSHAMAQSGTWIQIVTPQVGWVYGGLVIPLAGPTSALLP